MRGAQVSQVCSLIGIGISIGLAHLQLNLPTIVGGTLFIGLAIFTAFTMPEVGFQPIPQQERTSWRAMGDTFREGIRVVRERSVLVAILSIVIYWSIRLFRSLDQTINTIWINQHVDSRVRATIFSMTGQADAFGLAVGGPILGAVGRIVSLRAAMVAAGALLSPVLPIFIRTIRRYK